MRILTFKDFLTGSFVRNRDTPGVRVCLCSVYAPLGVVFLGGYDYVIECENCGATWSSYDLEEWS